MNEDSPLPSPDLRDIFKSIPDWRVKRTKYHQLEDILVIATCTMLCGQGHFTHMETFGKARQSWLETFLELPHGIPSHDTFRNVFVMLKPQRFMEAFILWTKGVQARLQVSGEGAGLEGVVAIDGKALRGAVASGQAPAVMVGAWATQLGLCLGQVKVDEKSNEITALPALLDLLILKGCIVTIDAMGCQREVAEKIIAQGGDYLLALKGNQSNLHEQVRCYLDEACELAREEKKYHEEETSGRGRHEIRRCWVMDDLSSWLEGVEKWKGLRSVAAVESERTINGVTRVERRYCITSLKPDAALIASSVRSHWGIENSLHWVLDVTFREDASRVRTGYAPENLSALRRLACSAIKRENPISKKSINQRKFEATLNPSYLSRLLGIILDA